MSRGTLQIAWINKGDGGDEHYHMMFGKDGENKTLRARSVKGRDELAHQLKINLKLNEGTINGALSELDASGQASVNGMEVADDVLQTLELG